MSSRRKCPYFKKKCEKFKVKELDRRLVKCVGSRQVKRVKSFYADRDRRLKKKDYCRLITTSPDYNDPYAVNNKFFLQKARRIPLKDKYSILWPLIMRYQKRIKPNFKNERFISMTIGGEESLSPISII